MSGLHICEDIAERHIERSKMIGDQIFKEKIIFKCVSDLICVSLDIPYQFISCHFSFLKPVPTNVTVQCNVFG